MSITKYLSLEILFWLPALTDLLLLIITYTSCRRHGKQWFFQNSPDWNEDDKKFTEVNKTLNAYHEAREKILWDLAMIAAAVVAY